jgi:hypothetical protein
MLATQGEKQLPRKKKRRIPESPLDTSRQMLKLFLTQGVMIDRLINNAPHHLRFQEFCIRGKAPERRLS